MKYRSWMAHTAILRWVHHYAPEFERRWELVRTAGRAFVADPHVFITNMRSR